jgi:hypothetical protein
MKFPAPKPPEVFKNKILIAKKAMHQGAMFGHISNGGGEIDLGNGYGLQFVRDGSPFVKLQLFKYGIDARVETQGWTKSKVIIEKAPEPEAPEEVEVKIDVAQRSLI